MPVLSTNLDPRATSYTDNRAAMLERLAELDTALRQARAGGGDRYVTRHHARGKLLARERIELLLDRDAPFLELSPVAGWGTEYPVGASVVTGIGVVEGALCMIIANDATVRGGALNPYTVEKIRRAGQVAETNHLPVINLVEIGGGAAAAQSPLFLPGGALYRDLVRLSTAGIGTVAVVFGEATGAAAFLAGLSDTTILVRDRAGASRSAAAEAGMAIGQQADDQSLGGAATHPPHSGLAHHVAEDERDAVRLARGVVARLPTRRRPVPDGLPQPPKHDPDDLLGIPPVDQRAGFDPREILARILDESRFDEFQPAYGTGLCAGWGAIHGYRVGIVGNIRGVPLGAEAAKATQFLELAGAAGTPLVFLQHPTGHAVGTEYPRGGIVARGATMINAVAASSVPHLTVRIGAGDGTGTSGICGPGPAPAFLFTWPSAKAGAAAGTVAVGGAAQPPGALDLSGRLHDDGVIDPRDTRTVLGLCLSVVAPRSPLRTPGM